MAPVMFRYLQNIWILETSVAYRREVARYLDLMRTTRSGRILCNYINSRSTWMLIMPFQPTAKEPVNAYAQPVNDADSAPQYYLMLQDLVLPNKMVIKVPSAAGLGTGRGSSVWVAYHPATWRQLIKNAHMIPAGAGPAQVLLHEMTHGMREMYGMLRLSDAVPENARMDDIEEFYAILAANIYGSERGMTSMRADHWGHARLNARLSDPAVYYQTYKKEIDTWFREQQAYCLDMARIRTKFNPLREAAVALRLLAAS